MKILIMLSLLFFSKMVYADTNALAKNSVYNVESSWVDENNKATALKIFLGKPVVLAMVYTSCQAACPLLVADMQKIEKDLGANKIKVSFVLVSFDSDKDTPKELSNFAKVHGLDLSRWSLLTSTPDAVRELAAVLNVQYKKDEDGNFSHSNVITILDAQGKIAYQQTGLAQDPKSVLKTLSEFISKK